MQQTVLPHLFLSGAAWQLMECCQSYSWAECLLVSGRCKLYHHGRLSKVLYQQHLYRMQNQVTHLDMSRQSTLVTLDRHFV